MSTFKKSTVVMLPTNEKATIKDQLCIGAGNYLFSARECNNVGTLQPQDLYFLSDKNVEEGDFGYISIGINGTIGKISYDSEYKTWDLTTDDDIHYPFSIKKYIKKIIASTNKSLGLPEPSKAFIDVYIEEYNKGKQITEVMVKWEETEGDIISVCWERAYGSPDYMIVGKNGIASITKAVKHYEDRNVTAVAAYGKDINGKVITQFGSTLDCAGNLSFGKSKTKTFVKINPKNNTITIKKIKDSWNREELEELFRKYEQDTACYGRDGYYNDIDIPGEWIKENL